MRAGVLVVLAGCWHSTPASAVPPVATPPEPARVVAGTTMLAWNGDAFEPSQPIVFGENDAGRTKGDEFALVGCVGLVGRARLVELEERGWRFEILARASQWTPTRTCRTGENIAVFAVSPPDRVRDGGRGEADATALYASLPRRYRRWQAGARYNIANALAQWADLDADGEVDLVQLNGPCHDGDAANCTVILARETAWRRVGGTATSIH